MPLPTPTTHPPPPASHAKSSQLFVQSLRVLAVTLLLTGCQTKSITITAGDPIRLTITAEFAEALPINAAGARIGEPVRLPSGTYLLHAAPAAPLPP